MYRRAAVVAGIIALSATAAAAREPIRLGWVENAKINHGNLVMKAKMDTGARTTSIHTDRYELFKRNGRRWVRFTVKSGDKSQDFEKPVVRMVRIRRAGVDVQRRPVVEMGICIGGYFKMAKVNLTQRHRMFYKLLIGRLYMGNVILIDSSRTFVGKPECPDAPK